MIAQSYDDFFHDHSDKQLDVSTTNKPDVVETKVDTKLWKAYTLSDHRSPNLNNLTRVTRRTVCS